MDGSKVLKWQNTQKQKLKQIKNGIKIIKKRVQYINKRSATKSFILNLATEEDLKNIEAYIIERKAKLKESK